MLGYVGGNIDTGFFQKHIFFQKKSTPAVDYSPQSSHPYHNNRRCDSRSLSFSTEFFERNAVKLVECSGVVRFDRHRLDHRSLDAGEGYLYDCISMMYHQFVGIVCIQIEKSRDKN
jgi:hypothetical protein